MNTEIETARLEHTRNSLVGTTLVIESIEDALRYTNSAVTRGLLMNVLAAARQDRLKMDQYLVECRARNTEERTIN